MTAVGRGIDETRGAGFVDVQVAGPQIAVEARRRLLGTDERVETREQALEVPTHGRRRAPSSARELELGREALAAIKFAPARVRRVRLRQAGDEVRLVEAERAGGRAMERGESATELLVERGAARCGFEQLEREEARRRIGEREDARHA